MTDQDEREFTAAFKEYRNSQLTQLGAIVRGQSDVLREIGEVKAGVWDNRAALGRLEERYAAHDHRIVKLESWRDAKDCEAADTGRHDISRLQAQLAARDAAKVERRRHWIRYGIATAVGLVTAVGLTWVGMLIGGCV